MSFYPTNNTEGWSKLPHGNWSLFTLQNKHAFCWGGSMLTAPSNLCSQRGRQNPGIHTYLSRLRCKLTSFWSHVPSLSAGSLCIATALQESMQPLFALVELPVLGLKQYITLSFAWFDPLHHCDMRSFQNWHEISFSFMLNAYHIHASFRVRACIFCSWVPSISAC